MSWTRTIPTDAPAQAVRPSLHLKVHPLTQSTDPPAYGDDENALASEPLLFNGFSSAREHPAGYADGRNSSEGFDHLLPEGEGAKSTLMAGIANVSFYDLLVMADGC